MLLHQNVLVGPSDQLTSCYQFYLPQPGPPPTHHPDQVGDIRATAGPGSEQGPALTTDEPDKIEAVSSF